MAGYKYKIEFSILNLQRNGIGGNPFYVAEVQDLSEDRIVNLLVTFEESRDLDMIHRRGPIDESSCRAVQIDDFTSSWRGDHYASLMNKVFKKMTEDLDFSLYNMIGRTFNIEFTS